VKRFELSLKILLAFTQVRYVALEQIKLSLQIDPATHNQGGQEHQLHKHRDIYLTIQTPALPVRPATSRRRTGGSNNAHPGYALGSITPGWLRELPAVFRTYTASHK
jgi:hypothetical protein